jgi:DNA modification methylase/DNA-directed RNA polymerase subunit RPC12/RpoP
MVGYDSSDQLSLKLDSGDIDNERIALANFVPSQHDVNLDFNFLKKIEGCPLGDQDDILRLSNPPQYCAFPNPYLHSFIRSITQNNQEKNFKKIKALSADVVSVRSGPVYDAHSYATKVPPEAIAQYILHYTNPGDLVLDFFCGTGTTGVAAQMCSSPPKRLKAAVEESGREVNWGTRFSILSDLSPMATFIAANLNLPVNSRNFEKAAVDLIHKAEQEIGWVYRTEDEQGNGTIKYVIWADILRCPNCGDEFDFWSTGLDFEKGGIKKNLQCPHCSSTFSKSEAERVIETVYDTVLGQPRSKISRKPVLVNYELNGKRYEREPNSLDIQRLEKIRVTEKPDFFPVEKMMFSDGAWGDLYRAGYHTGFTHVHNFYTERNLLVLSVLWRLTDEYPPELALALKFLVSSYNLSHSTLMTRVIFKKGNPKPVLTGYQTGALYVSSLPVEKNIIEGIRTSKLPQILKAYRDFERQQNSILITTQSSTSLDIPENSVDYIFIDPPFGDNIKYSEGNFISEAWLKCFTNTKSEAIVSSFQGKDEAVYQSLIKESLNKAFKALKPGKWMTIEFHNSKNRIWNLIQEAILEAGFVIANVSTLDKKQGSFKQVTTSGAVKQDLIISAYKPTQEVLNVAGRCVSLPDSVWEFVEGHLEKLAIFLCNANSAQVIGERQKYLLYDRMIAFYIQRGLSIPISAPDFYAGLNQRYPQRDDMYFLPEQVAEYDRKRLTVKEVLQLELFVNDESTARQWLRQQLTKKPQTFQELHPNFLKAIGGWSKHEKSLELSHLLEQDFFCFNSGAIPKQIVSWLAKSSTHRARLVGILGAKSGDADTSLLDQVPDTGLETRDASLIAAAKDRWYIPDPSKEADLEKLRDRALLREFEEYRTGTRRLKVFRMEAMRAGFKHYFQERDYKTIIQVARKIPETILQEDPKLLMFYDNAVTRAGEE